MTLGLREVTIDDGDQLLRWVNQPDTLKGKLNTTGPIQRNTHFAWLRRRLDDHDTLMYIILLDDQSAGQVRLQSDSQGRVTIDIFVAETARGRGVATFAVATALECWHASKGAAVAEAVIKRENLASAKLFAALGFSLVSEDEAVTTFHKAITGGEGGIRA